MVALLSQWLCLMTIYVPSRCYCARALNDKHPKDRTAKSYAIKKNPSITKLLEEAERHELEPLSSASSSSNQSNSSKEEISKSPASAASNEPPLPVPIKPASLISPTESTSSTQKQPYTPTSWHDTFTSLRRRFIPDSQKVAPAAPIEMTNKNTAPTAATPTKYSHID